jgi:hypothetical protein
MDEQPGLFYRMLFEALGNQGDCSAVRATDK